VQTILRQKAALAALVAWCCVLLGVRFSYSGTVANGYLLWNLFLAVVPVVAACALRIAALRPGRVVVKVIAFGVWLAFLPNAPYLATDLVHLSRFPPIPLWFDVALFASYAATGVLLGYSSVADVEVVVSARFGEVAGLSVAVVSLLLCGFGIYLGRFLRWNSWDVVTTPLSVGRQIAHQVVHPVSHSLTWEVTAIYGVGLAVGYLALRGVAGAWGAGAASAA
jgi:uncharacterized membrane protein